jgi:hypothetical protein
MQFSRNFLSPQENIKWLTARHKLFNILLKKKLIFIFHLYLCILCHVAQLRYISLHDDFVTWCERGNKLCASLHYHRRLATYLYCQIQFIKGKIKILESNSIIDFIEGEARPDGPLKKDEIIFSHDQKLYVITIENLFRMQPTVHLHAYDTHKLKARVMRPNVNDKKISYSLRFEIQMSEGKQIVSCDTLVENFGFDVVKTLFSSMKKANIMQCTLDGVLYNIAFDTTKPPSSALILIDPSLRIFFHVGTFNICSCCMECVPKKQMREHMEAHIRADREQVMSSMSTLIACPNCGTFIDKFKPPLEKEGCNHMHCIRCQAAVCYRCAGLRSYHGESRLPDPSTFFVKNGREYTKHFRNFQNILINKEVPICSNTCCEKHNMCDQLQTVDGVLQRVVCHDGIGIMVDEHESDEYSTHQQLQDMGISPEEIEQLRQLQVVQDRMDPLEERQQLQQLQQVQNMDLPLLVEDIMDPLEERQQLQQLQPLLVQDIMDALEER